MTSEVDPTGKSPHAPGAKLDAGKIQPRLIIEGMARAIWAMLTRGEDYGAPALVSAA